MKEAGCLVDQSFLNVNIIISHLILGASPTRFITIAYMNSIDFPKKTCNNVIVMILKMGTIFKAGFLCWQEINFYNLYI